MLSTLRNYKMAVLNIYIYKQIEHCELDFCVCKFNSWCRFPMYEVDFGMGKPT